MSIYKFKVLDKLNQEISLKQFEGQVILIVNTASKCGFTPQYTALQELYDEFKTKGFTVLGFPCGQFANQEFSTNREIQNFCQLNYHITFPIMGKIDVNGENSAPLYRYLKDRTSSFFWQKPIKWNFTKFLIDRQGNVIKRYSSMTLPQEIRKDIIDLL